MADSDVRFTVSGFIARPVHDVFEAVADPDERIVLEWGGEDAVPDEDGDGTHTTVTMTFEPTDDDRTLVSITEEGWQETEAGRKASYGNCMGWTGMLAAAKVWIEHGINLREGFYK